MHARVCYLAVVIVRITGLARPSVCLFRTYGAYVRNQKSNKL